ncbi:hypothetical protein NW768_007357 [Fusarium equiseti]|uniref:Uncharacterized protein n=1 Tax=Fusarium equiseti TaxID=61235 RepID=A0ABQ8R7E8_FUSEQ|nr:hypothetical protein NW768_007357 [Fusarium equiseti]
MKLTNAILPLLASWAAAQHVEIQIGDSAALSITRQIFEAEKNGDHERAAELRALMNMASPLKERVEWKTECSVSSNFEAEIYSVPSSSQAPKEIAWAMDYLDKYWTTDAGGDLPYPGDFDQFMHPDGFRVIRVDYKDLPWAVRKYREELLAEGTKMERKFIAEKDGVAFFAPGVVTWLAPLFAGAKVNPGKNACEDEIVDFSNWGLGKTESSNVKFSFNFGGRMQIGNSIAVQVNARKLVNEGSEKNTEGNFKQAVEEDVEVEDEPSDL